jgi:hypothetical protein
MFERYTEKARRAIFFARYEASQYGNPHIDFEALFVPYSKKNARYTIEETVVSSNDHLVAIVLWKNALVASMERVWMHRMTVVLVPKGTDWTIGSMQITPVKA